MSRFSSLATARSGITRTGIHRGLSELSIARKMSLFSSNLKSSAAALARADASPHDPYVQAQAAAALNRDKQYQAVIQRWESRAFAPSDGFLREYVKALVGAKVLPADQAPGTLTAMRSAMAESTAAAGTGTGPAGMLGAPVGALAAGPSIGAGIAGAAGAAGANPNSPLYVHALAAQPHWASLLLRFIIAPLVLIGGLGYVMNTSMSKLTPGEAGLFGEGSEPEPATVPTTRLSDVIGIDDSKRELADVVDFLRNPRKYQQLGARLPKGVLLTGPPGTGKTLLARAVAGEAGVKFFSRSGSDFEEVYVGVGAKRVRALFDAAKEASPAIIFIDEIDSLGASRTTRAGAADTRQVLNQLLTCMDGFDSSEANVIVIAATNDPNALDSALRRKGRFDAEVAVPKPDREGRQALFEYYLKKVKVAAGVSVETLARATSSLTGADIAAMVNAAAIWAAQRGGDTVTMADLEEARDKQWMGTAHRSRRVTEEETKRTAFHEAGHTLVSLFTPGAPLLHKVTVLGRGMSGGSTHFLEPDGSMQTKRKLAANIDVAFGGYVAEQMIYGDDEVTTGPLADLSSATSTARNYVKRFGMSSAGFTEWSDAWNDPASQPAEATRAKIDAQVEELLQAAHKRVRTLLQEHETELHALADALVEHETLDAEQVKAVLAGKPIPKHKAGDFVTPDGGPSAGRGLFGGRLGRFNPRCVLDQGG